MAMIGNRQHYQPMKSAFENGSLARFITDFWLQPGSPLRKYADLLSPGKKEIVKTRFGAELKHADVVALTGTGMLQHLGLRMKSSRAWSYKVYAAAGRRFARHCVPYLDVPHTAYLGFTSAALEALESENRSGILTVLNQIDPARIEEEIVFEEMQRHKSWVLHGQERIPRAYFERVSAEWSAAKRIFVNSAWSKSALIQQGVPAQKIRVCPLAYKPAVAHAKHVSPRGARLRVLWLGTLCLRKGIVYAVEAARRLADQPIDFTLVGPNEVRLPALPANCTYADRIPRSQIGALYSSHDIFILPTLSDGFALTQLEAMAHGLPVIATSHCGEVVEDGVSGRIVPARDSRSLAEAIVEIGGDSHKLEAMSHAALARAGQFTPANVWHTYQSHLI
jgi:glycosyltransferase involved in cell wall biosynthesis